ncbi:MarR family winged helix-turn-helix transcriptional regulator [Shouchella sp. JSM 1781072]|uniref:MarR family winged helix-turn-helix transcriptional regulator n=1 Tax=Bacillaceae TaxID=186817 RepID=UPI000C075EE5|nr:MarR family transcriptional regulator [Bacillus sp. Marseille-P3800]
MFESFDESIGFMTAQTHRTMFRAFTAYLKTYGITPEQWTVIKRLHSHGDLPQKELAAVSEKDKATLTRIVDLLERKTIIVKRNNPEDKRSHYVSLTERGSTLYERILPGTEAFYQDIVADISESDLQTYVQTLKKIRQKSRQYLE